MSGRERGKKGVDGGLFIKDGSNGREERSKQRNEQDCLWFERVGEREREKVNLVGVKVRPESEIERWGEEGGRRESTWVLALRERKREINYLKIAPRSKKLLCPTFLFLLRVCVRACVGAGECVSECVGVWLVLPSLGLLVCCFFPRLLLLYYLHL